MNGLNVEKVVSGGDVAGMMETAEMFYSNGRLDEAKKMCLQEMETGRRKLEALFMLGNIAYAGESFAEAISYYRQACEIERDIPVLLNNLGLALKDEGRPVEALAALDRAIFLSQGYAVAHYNRALALEALGRDDDAVDAYRTAIDCRPDYIDALKNLGSIHFRNDRHDEAILCFQKALAIEPDNLDFIYNMGLVFDARLNYEDALRCFKRCMDINPRMTNLYGKIGKIFGHMGMPELGVEYLKKSIENTEDLKEQRATHSCLLFFMHYSSSYSPERIASEHFRWAERYLGHIRTGLAVSPDNLMPERPLRIGYVSPDFRIHSVVFFIQPVLAAHNGDKFEIYCYSDVKKPDKITEQLQRHPVTWRDISGNSDDEVFDLVRNDRIDILVDLAGHSANNRLAMFARKPASIQVSWIGYPDTTGLKTMDYRITDVYADPPGMTEKYHSEELLRLPDSFLCYRPGGDFPEKGPLPAERNGFITFGSFNNFAKVTPEMIFLWARILLAVPRARLLLKAHGTSLGAVHKRILKTFSDAGVDEERISVLERTPSVTSHLDVYNQVDISLDTYPYNGTTTTFESLWMGVPVLTMAGSAHVSRVGASILFNAGLASCIGSGPDDYVAKAEALASDTGFLASIRSGLRERMRSSPVMDAERFTRNLEEAYRAIWVKRCLASRARKG